MVKPRVRDSVSYFKFTLTEDTGKNLTADTVMCAIELPGTDSADITWLPAVWETGNVWHTSDPITWSTDNYPPVPGVAYQGLAKITDTPETPWIDLGPVPIKEH